MRFDESGKRIAATPAVVREGRKAVYWFEQEKVDEQGFCDEPIPCVEGLDITHLCSRFTGHSGRCVAMHKGASGGRPIRRLEYG